HRPTSECVMALPAGAISPVPPIDPVCARSCFEAGHFFHIFPKEMPESLLLFPTGRSRSVFTALCILGEPLYRGEPARGISADRV
ncbi:MAG: hypothetical protein OXF73_14510, partial [Gammaproteobacteria bacterium]|nr:hypothetical protein [Gammaproteobacteria bacterium]MCY4227096.1 hypothetical protein [Gammaproteobacteria bacterium]